MNGAEIIIVQECATLKTISITRTGVGAEVGWACHPPPITIALYDRWFLGYHSVWTVPIPITD